MQTIVQFGLTKAGIRRILHTVVKHGPRSLGGNRNFDPLVIKGVVRIAFLIKNYWKLTQSIQLFWANISTLQLEAGRGGSIFKNDYTETKR